MESIGVGIGLDRRPRRALPLGLFGMLALVIGFESHLNTHPANSADLGVADWRMTRRAAAAEARDADLLIFGDSLLKMGIVPESLGDRLGCRVYNLSLLGGNAASSFFLLRRALESGARPKAILLDCQDDPTRGGSSHGGAGIRLQVRLLAEGLGWRDAIDLASVATDPGFLPLFAARKLLASLRGRAELRVAAGRLLRGLPGFDDRTSRAQARNFSIHRGSILMPDRANPATAPAVVEPADDWAAERMTGVFLARFLDLAADRGIKVYYLLPPTTPELAAERVRSGVQAYLSRQADDLRRRYPGVRVVDGRSGGYVRDLFVDACHLGRRGASAVTNDVGDAILGGLATTASSSRRAELPRYRPCTDEPGLEDLEQSRLAIDPTRRQRR